MQEGREAFGHGMVVATHHAAVPGPPQHEAGKGQTDQRHQRLERAPLQLALPGAFNRGEISSASPADLQLVLLAFICAAICYQEFRIFRLEGTMNRVLKRGSAYGKYSTPFNGGNRLLYTTNNKKE